MYLFSRSTSFTKIFFLLSVCGLITYVVLAIYTFQLSFVNDLDKQISQHKSKICRATKHRRTKYEMKSSVTMKFILVWKTPEFHQKLTTEGQHVFKYYDCHYKNCYITANESLLDDVKYFDAVIFSISNLRSGSRFPKRRTARQKYIFYSMIPAKNNPICTPKADEFFNWTWTYKLHSDIVTPFIEVKDLKGKVLAPKAEIDWPEIMNPLMNISISTKSKSKAVMWYIEKCSVNELPHPYVKKLKNHLKAHSLEVDVFGCGYQDCPPEGCLNALKEYSFYLAFEEYLSDDYVTKEILKAFNHDAVPIVMGEADYGKFLPPNSYIDARYESPESLAALIADIIKNPFLYKAFFYWRAQYKIEEGNTKDGYCQLCSLLNNKERRETRSSYEFFRQWWYVNNIQKRCYPKGAESMVEMVSNVENPPLGDSYLP